MRGGDSMGSSKEGSPNAKLAAEIAKELVAKWLIPTDTEKELLAKLNGAGVTKDDWRLWVDLATTPRRPTGSSNA